MEGAAQPNSEPKNSIPNQFEQKNEDCGRLSTTNGTSPILPFLRWAGGKQLLTERLVECVPKDYRERDYFEPFLGAGAMFFHLRPKVAHLSDANEYLIDTYRKVRTHWKTISRQLSGHRVNASEDYYYALRDEYNDSRFTAAQAARFIFLNKSCFNGIFRVNQKGEFNVPYGWKNPPALPDLEHLKAISEALSNATLRAIPFETALSKANEKSFVYLDPPYPPLNGTAYFTHYTEEKFSLAAQLKLLLACKCLNMHGALFMMTNADTRWIRKLYREFNLSTISVTRYITCKAVRHRVKELVITNY